MIVRMTLKVQRLRPDAQLPSYAHGPDEDAGMDLRAIDAVMLEPGVPVAVPTGIAIEHHPPRAMRRRFVHGAAWR